MLTIPAFLLALGLLIAIHEYGHYRAAVACGVKVLRFSVGFGKPVLRWQSKTSETEFVLGLFPLGGYVKMLDEREGPVAADQRHRAFNTQPLKFRALIVAAGPVANLLLALLIYAAINWAGVEQAKPILASPVAGSVAERAGLRGGEVVKQVALNSDEFVDVKSFEELRWTLTRAALDGDAVRLLVADQYSGRAREVRLPLEEIQANEVDAQLSQKIGLLGPLTAPEIGEILPGGAAQKADLRKFDKVLQIESVVVIDGQQLRALIRQAGSDGTVRSQKWRIEREGQVKDVFVEVQRSVENGQSIGRIGAYVGARPETTIVRYGLIDGLASGFVKTWEVSGLTLRMMGKMLVGQASIKNLSGPLTIADYAGKSANLGFTSYLTFLALISISLGVLNLLPLPVLDGGHLMYYLWEAVTGHPPADAWMDRLQRGGVAILMVMMSVAIFNDLSRILG